LRGRKEGGKEECKKREGAMKKENKGSRGLLTKGI
jgi:hypothetical protein